ncbi:MAG TPA: transcriptional regulator [Acidimicrobiaceae bacterium]|jgi:transcriptional regulator with XRE-family HTH domain|nr:transcriptional regulator [Acidimicrobiaceae bacterium]
MCSDRWMRNSPELAEFLRLRRATITPAEAGLPTGPRRRTPGLRREELAMLAGVSVSWYTWLEQGRPINPSADVLDALARVLRLDAVEREHLNQLAVLADQSPSASAQREVPPWAQRLLDQLNPAPAYLLGPTWDYMAWNEGQERLFPPIATLEPQNCNLVWAMFAVPQTRELILDWESEARQTLSQFRAETTPFRNDQQYCDLIARLQEASEEFAQWWSRHDVAAFHTRIRRFRGSDGSEQLFEYQQLIDASDPQLRIVAQFPLHEHPAL